MNPVDSFMILGLLVLRVAVPVAVLALLAYALNWLDRRWEEEAREQATQTLMEQPSLPKVARERGIDLPGVQLPFDPGLIRQPAPVMAALPGQHCWETRGCTESQRAACPAYAHPNMRCWQARLRFERQLPQQCFTCDVYKHYPPT